MSKMLENMERISKLGAIYSQQIGLDHTKLEFTSEETCQILGLMRNGKPMKGALRKRIKSGLLWPVRRGNYRFFSVEAIANCQHIEAMISAPVEYSPPHIDPEVKELIYGTKHRS